MTSHNKGVGLALLSINLYIKQRPLSAGSYKKVDVMFWISAYVVSTEQQAISIENSPKILSKLQPVFQIQPDLISTVLKQSIGVEVSLYF